jgi:hypothetical protein
MHSPFCYLNSSTEVIRRTVMMCIRFQMSLRQGKDLLVEHGIDICHEMVRSMSAMGHKQTPKQFQLTSGVGSKADLNAQVSYRGGNSFGTG